MHPQAERLEQLNRRRFLDFGRGCLGTAALATLLQNDSALGNDQSSPNHAADSAIGGIPELPHHRPTAKRVIYLFMAGGPSHIDMFDYKPVMRKLHGTELPDSIRNGQRLTGMSSGQATFPCVAPMFNLTRHGQVGTWVNAELLPNLSKLVDEMTIIKSMNTEAINHDPAMTFINTGTQQLGRPSMGSWLSYGLGSPNQDLPAYVTMISVGAKPGQALFSRLWGSGFLPSQHQGVQFRSGKDPVLYLNNPPGISPQVRRQMLDGLAKLNSQHFDQMQDPEIQTRISQYEMAYRMQTSVPDLMNMSDEPESTYELYGEESRKPGTFSANCILARRLAERGVPFVQLFHRGWDQHGNLPNEIRRNCRGTDQAAAGLIRDLKQRGMLDDTIVIFGGEFGRTIYSQGKLTPNNHGRDHHGRCFTTCVAGGGFKRGFEYGLTDDYSYNILENPVHINDFSATLLHALGIDHERFTVKYQGLDWRLTGVEGAKVVHDLLG